MYLCVFVFVCTRKRMCICVYVPPYVLPQNTVKKKNKEKKKATNERSIVCSYNFSNQLGEVQLLSTKSHTIDFIHTVANPP